MIHRLGMQEPAAVPAKWGGVYPFFGVDSVPILFLDESITWCLCNVLVIKFLPLGRLIKKPLNQSVKPCYFSYLCNPEFKNHRDFNYV